MLGVRVTYLNSCSGASHALLPALAASSPFEGELGVPPKPYNVGISHGLPYAEALGAQIYIVVVRFRGFLGCGQILTKPASS